MKKKYPLKSLLLLSLCLFFSLNISAQVDLTADVDVTPPLTNGQTFNYTIVAAGPAWVAVRVRLLYDPSIVQVNSFTPVYAFDVEAHSTLIPGLIQFEGGDLSPIASDITLFSIEFEVLDATQTINIAHDYDVDEGTVVLNNSATDILGVANDIILAPLSINDNEIKNNLSIFPNPVQDRLYIQTKGNLASNIQSIKIHAIDGKLVKYENNVNSINGRISLDISNLKSAMYFMTVTSKDAERATYKVLVK